MNLYDLCSGVRLKLSDPRANRPGDAQLLDQICMQIRTAKRLQRNTSNPWNFNDLLVQVTPTDTTYRINVADFGTPLAVLTWAPNNPSWVARLIPFSQPQNMSFDYSLPNMAGAFLPYDGSNCTALRCSFYWTDGQPYIEFLPPPGQMAEYKVRYLASANHVNDAALTQTLVSNEDADLVMVRAAIGLLSTTEWLSPDTKDNRAYNAERRRDLGVTLSNDERELRRQFEAAQLITDGPRTTVRWNPCDG